MKSLAIIGASYLQLPLVEKAKRMGLRTICFAWTKGSVCAEIADKFYPISIIEKEHILDICRKEGIDGICTIASDIAAPTVAYVAEALRLNGNSYQSAVRANDKFLMRKAFTEAGIPCPKFTMIDNDGQSDFTGWCFPLIVKPCDRSGSIGVMKVANRKELQESIAIARSLSFRHEAIVEEFVEGREISVEFITFKGMHYPLTITDKVTSGPPHFVELEHHQPAKMSSEQFKGIFSLTEKALNSLGITNGASHTEYIIRDNGDIFIIELGARMGGDFIGSDLVELSTGYDFLKGVIDVALGTFHEPVLQEHHHSGVFFLCKESERLLSIFQEDRQNSAIVKKELMASILKSVTCSADRSGYIIYQADKRLSL